MRIILSILLLNITFSTDETSKVTSPVIESRDIDCDSSIGFCNESSPLFSAFNCDWVCIESHNRTIGKCSNSQYYSSLSHLESIILYDAVTDYFDTNILNYECLRSGQYGIDMDIIDHELNFDLNFIIEDINCGWWDNGDGYFETGDVWSENYKKGWGHFSINAENSDPLIAIHVNHTLHDENSDFLAGYIFNNQELKPKWMLSGGSHRYAKVNTLEFSEECECDIINFGADIARSEAINPEDCNNSYVYTTPLQVYHEALSDHIDNLYSLSIHGFDDITLDSLLIPYNGTPSFILSNGNSVVGNDCIPPDHITSTIFHYLKDYFSGQSGDFGQADPEILEAYSQECGNINNEADIAVIVQQEILCEHQPITCSSDLLSPFEEFGGIHNPQGRYTNGYFDDSINVGDHSMDNNDIWTQIEIHSCIRNNIILYERTASIISQAIYNCKNYNCIECNNESHCSNEAFGVDYQKYDYECNCLDTGDLNCDGYWNVLDVVTLANCVLYQNCDDSAGDMNGDDEYNVLDIVLLVNCILTQNCG